MRLTDRFAKGQGGRAMKKAPGAAGALSGAGLAGIQALT